MQVKNIYQGNSYFSNLELLAKSIVEGYISGLHKSPFHGFSSEFSEHKIYNNGESTKHIDWKLFAKTDKLYTKRFQDETNLRSHLIIDQSLSMHYPISKSNIDLEFNKIEFCALASAALLHILKKQRDAAGLSLYDGKYNFYAPEKGGESHYRMLVNQLQKSINVKPNKSTTKTYEVLHQIAEKLHRRSLVFLFTDLFQNNIDSTDLFESIRHLKFNKHELILFHVHDKKTEFDFNYDNLPKRFFDVESNSHIDIFPQNLKKEYNKEVKKYFDFFRLKCLQYKINYVDVDIRQGFDKILTTFFEKRHKFL